MRVLAITNLYPSEDAPWNGVFVEQQIQGLVSRGVVVRVLFLDRRGKGPGVYLGLVPRLRRELAEFCPQVIHVMYGGVMAQQVTSERGLPPVAVTFHGSDLLGENFSGLWRKLVSRYGVHCSRKAARRAQGVVVVARHLQKALGQDVDQSKVRVIPCGIDLQRFKPLDRSWCQGRLGWAPENFHVLFATSSGDPVKRPELARAAVDQLQKEGRRIQLHVLAGIPNQEVPIWLHASDALLLTSRQEGSPTIVKEALACGLPIVSVDVGDVAERIEGIANCHLAEAELADLTRKLDLVIQRRERIDCRQKLHELSLEAVAGKLDRFYQEMLTGSLCREGSALLPSSVRASATKKELETESCAPCAVR